mgnify:CR=1 FL=1
MAGNIYSKDWQKENMKGITDSSFTKFMCDKYMSNEHRLGELREKRFVQGLNGLEKNLYHWFYDENEQIEKMFNSWFRSLYLKYKEKYPNTGKACLTFNYNSMYTHEFIDEETKMIKVDELLDFVTRSYGV